MNWRNTLLKEYGDKFRQPDGTEFIEGYGFVDEPFRSDRQPITRDEQGNPLEGEERDKRMQDFRNDPKNPKITELVNWFKVNLEQPLEDMLDSIGPFNVSAEGQAGFRTIRREPSQLKNQIKDLGVTIAKNMVDSLLEGFMDAITKDPKFNDEMTNIQRIYSSSGYNRTYSAGLKMAEELMSSIFDTSYKTVRASADADVEDDELSELMDVDPMGKVPPEFVNDVWSAAESTVTKDVKSILSNIDEYLEDVITQDQASIDLFDLDNDGENDVTPAEISNSIKSSIQRFASNSETVDLLKDFTGAVAFAFTFRYPYMQKRMEANELVADQTTEEEAEEMRNRPEIEFGEEDEETRRKFEDKFKSNEQYTGEFGWRDVLSKEFGTTMTTNAGFTPNISNRMFGKKKPCKDCRDKTTPCGCGK